MEVKRVFLLFVALTLVGFVSTAFAVTNGDDISHGWGVVANGSYSVPDSFRNGSPMITTYGAMDTLALNGNDISHGWGVVTNGSYSVPTGTYVTTGYGTMERKTTNGDDISHGWGVIPGGSYNMPR